MPDAQPKPTAAEVLREHRDSRWVDSANATGGGGYYCRCGRRFSGSIWQHQEDTLATAGLLVTAEPTVVRVHYGDSEAHARSFNEGFETAVAQGLADDPALAQDWLAEHDAQVAARTLRDAAEVIGWHVERPAEARGWLRVRADRIAAGGES